MLKSAELLLSTFLTPPTIMLVGGNYSGHVNGSSADCSEMTSPSPPLFFFLDKSVLRFRLLVFSAMYVPKELYGAQDMHEYVPKHIYASLRNPPVALPRRVLSFLTIAVPFSIFWLLLSHDGLPSFLSAGPARTTTTHWHGWANVENLIILYAIS